MLEVEGWNANPEALSVPVLTCVVCHEYCSSSDLLGVVRWDDVQTVAMAYHVGPCVDLVMRVGENLMGGALGDHHIGEQLEHLVKNVASPPAPDADGLVRRAGVPADLRRTVELLDLVAEAMRAHEVLRSTR